MGQTEIQTLINLLTTCQTYLKIISKHACIRIPAPEGSPYEFEDISILSILSTPEKVYKTSGGYALLLLLVDGSKRLVEDANEDMLNVIYSDIESWRYFL